MKIQHKHWPFEYEGSDGLFQERNLHGRYHGITFIQNFGPFQKGDCIDEVDIAGYHFTYRVQFDWKNLNLDVIYPVTQNNNHQNLTNDSMEYMCNP